MLSPKLVAVLVVALLAGIALWRPWDAETRSGEQAIPGESMRDSPGSPPDLNTSGTTHTKDPAAAGGLGGGSMHAQTTETLADLFGEVPDGSSAEWIARRVGTEGAVIAPEVRAVVSRTVQHTHLDVPPYRAAFLLGGSDLPWLRRFERAYADEHAALTKQYEGRELQDMLRDLQIRGRQVLAEIAAQRLRSEPELAERFDDGRLLRDLPEGSEDRAWLEALISTVEDASLWTSHPEELPSSFRILLSAKDLPFLRRLGKDMAHVRASSPPHLPTPPEVERRARDIARELAEYLASRATD